MNNKTFAVTKDGKYNITWTKSPRKDKKYRIIVTNDDEKVLKTTDFGSLKYQHYKDTTPLNLYSHLNHLDNKRRDSYRARHKAIKTKDGKLAYKVKYSPAYMSYNYLW